MTASSEPAGASRGSRFLAAFFSNRPVALLVLTGWGIESAALTARPDTIYHADGVSLLLVWFALAWFWLTFGWVLWGGLTGMALAVRHAPRWLAVLAWLPVVLLMAVGVMAYGVSWGLYLQAGRFATVEVAKFFANNLRETWLYLVLAQRRELILVGCLGLAALVASPLFIRWVLRARWLPSGEQPLVKPWVAWCGVGTLVLAAWGIDRFDGSVMRQDMAMDALFYRLNPGVTLTASVVEAQRDSLVDDRLDNADLQPIRSNDWQPPPATERNRPSILFVAVESLRWDVVHLVHQGHEVTPVLNALARDGIYWPRSYAMSTHSDYADPCIPSSLYPLRTRRHHYYQASDPWPKVRIYDLVKPAGYATAHISSQSERWGHMDQFLASPNLDFFLDAETGTGPRRTSELDIGVAREVKAGTLGAGYLEDSYTVGVAVDWIKQQAAAHRPFFLNVTLENSHFPYDIAPTTPHPFQPCALGPEVAFMNYPVAWVPTVRNAYYNAIHECDHQVGRLVETLKETGRFDDTILVVTGDNGEAFHENGSVGHAQQPVEPALRVANVIHATGRLQPGTDDYPATHIDLVPTTLGLMGWPLHPNLQGIDLLAKDRLPVSQRLLFFHTESPVSRTDAVILAGRWKLHHNRDTGREMLYDLQTDPGEATDLLSAEPDRAARLREVLAAWRDRQLAYYQYPSHYSAYYPPKPPRWVGD